MNAAFKYCSLAGCELGHYRIVEKIGEGGMGEVFLAHDEHLGNNVALKVLPPDTDENRRGLFRKEAHALSKLNHPNIVTVLDFDTQQNLDFLVMEYVPGQALDERVREGALPEKEVIEIGVQLAEGLAAAHEQGIIHRDLKPGNLRLTKDNRLKILDFGLARSTLSFNSLASTVSAIGPANCCGTLPYMPSEQVLGQAADARTDIYSAGAVLYELYTGHPPFEEKLFTALVDDILHKAVVPPSHRRPGDSGRISAIILKCLEKSPEKRYQSAGDLARALRELARSEAAVKPAKAARGKRYGVAALLALLLIILTLQPGNRRMGPTRSPAVEIESLAVLPFANLSGDPQQEYLADGITDFLITDLGQMNILQRVISRTSVVQYKTGRQSLREIGHQLNVEAIVEGSVTRSEGRVQVSVRLVSAADDRQIWSHTYEGEFRDLLALQRKLALSLAREIKVNLPASDQGRGAAAHVVAAEAQEAYLRGRYLQFGAAEQRARSRQYFEQAIQADPSYAPAYAGLSDSYWNDIGVPPRETMAKAREYALKAVSLDEMEAHAHTAMGTVRFYGDWDWPAADREYQRALQLNPNDAEAHRMYAVFLAAMGRADEALAQVLAAQELDPLDYNKNTTAGWILYCARQYDQALMQCRKALELAPNYDSSHACLSYAYGGKGDSGKALEESRKAFELSSETLRTALLGRNYAGAHNAAEGHKILTQLLKRSHENYVPPYLIATLYAALGDGDSALRWIDAAYAGRDLNLVWIRVDPAVDSLRQAARFQQILERMQLASF